jgi:ABC-type Zn uptake system ZnuABC Zn-binding protein ZnuA
MRFNRWIIVILALVLVLPIGCGNDKAEEDTGPRRPLKVVATTSIVADIVGEIAKDKIDLEILIPHQADPHSYVLTPSNLVAVTDADLVFYSGLGLEHFIDEMVEQSGTEAELISVSRGIRARNFQEMSSQHRMSKEMMDRHDGGHSTSTETELRNPTEMIQDPHVWTNPNNVMVWVANIQEALGRLDKRNSEFYGTNANWYRTKLVDLDGRILMRVQEIPPLNRHIVTDHLFLGYFAKQYGFTQVGTIMPNADASSSPSIKQMTQLEELIRRLKVPTIYTGSPINEDVAQRIANDLRIDVRRIYSGSLADSGSRATSYMDYMEYNLEQIIEGLKPKPIKTPDPDRPGAIIR